MILDGLGHDQACDLPELGRLRERGVFRALHAHVPTFTAPNVVAMLTGRAPRDSRVRLNGRGVPDRPFETVLDVALEAGWDVRCHARQFRAFPAVVGWECRHGRLAFAMDLLVDPTPPGTFDLVHVGEVDDAGHEQGPESVSYAQRALHADRLVARVAASLDPDHDTLVVLSDHGHIPGGGHGGEEPEARDAFFLAAFGAIDRGRELPPRPMRDVASTLAQIAGMRPLAHDLGAPMLDVFRQERRPDAREALLHGKARLCDEWPQGIVEPTCVDSRGQQSSEVPPTTEAELRALAMQRDARLEAVEASARTQRAALSVVITLGATALALRVARRPSSPALAIALLVSNLGGYAAVLGALGYRVTFSRVAGTEIFLPHAATAVGIGVFATSVAARFASRLKRPVDPALAAAALLALGLLLALALYVGADPRALAPSRAAALLFLVAPAFIGSALAWALAGLANEPDPQN
jgi:hypothetical protein